jgi:hypothetical protein
MPTRRLSRSNPGARIDEAAGFVDRDARASRRQKESSHAPGQSAQHAMFRPVFEYTIEGRQLEPSAACSPVHQSGPRSPLRRHANEGDPVVQRHFHRRPPSGTQPYQALSGARPRRKHQYARSDWRGHATPMRARDGRPRGRPPLRAADANEDSHPGGHRGCVVAADPWKRVSLVEPDAIPLKLSDADSAAGRGCVTRARRYQGQLPRAHSLWTVAEPLQTASGLPHGPKYR